MVVRFAGPADAARAGIAAIHQELSLVGPMRVTDNLFLRDPGLVILDEASSRLDPATEQMLERAIDALLEGRTAIVIAHRLSTVKSADRIVVLHHGEIVESGTHSELLELGPTAVEEAEIVEDDD